MYRLTYNIYGRAGAFERSTIRQVEDQLTELIIRLYNDCTFHDQIYDVRFKYANGLKLYLDYQQTGDIVNHQFDKVGHYTIKLVK